MGGARDDVVRLGLVIAATIIYCVSCTFLTLLPFLSLLLLSSTTLPPPPPTPPGIEPRGVRAHADGA